MILADVKGQTEILSIGESHLGLLGQGQDKSQSGTFSSLNYDKESITFKDVKMKYNHAMALTEDSRIFVWGENNHYRSGLSEEKIYHEPTEIPFFSEYVVHDFDVSEYQSMVYASPKGNPDLRQMFLIGSKQGIGDLSGQNEQKIMHFKQFDNIEYDWFECGCEYFYLKLRGEDRLSHDVGVHWGYTCEVTNQSPIKGTMHFWKSDDSWHFVSRQGYEELKQNEEVPDICYATKYLIHNIQDKEWLEYGSNELLQEEPDENYPKYYAYNSKGDYEISPISSTDENGIFDYNASDSNPLILYRLARPLEPDAQPPLINLSNFHEETDEYGYQIDIEPDFMTKKNDHIISMNKNIIDNFKNFDEKHDKEL